MSFALYTCMFIIQQNVYYGKKKLDTDRNSQLLANPDGFH